MSWSVDKIGTPDNIAKALDAESEKLTGMSKEEFDQAKPHLQGLLAMNVRANPQWPMVIRLQANGHAVKDSSGKITESNCRVTLETTGAQLV